MVNLHNRHNISASIRKLATFPIIKNSSCLAPNGRDWNGKGVVMKLKAGDMAD
jgi:hypothetical protein